MKRSPYFTTNPDGDIVTQKDPPSKVQKVSSKFPGKGYRLGDAENKPQNSVSVKRSWTQSSILSYFKVITPASNKKDVLSPPMSKSRSDVTSSLKNLPLKQKYLDTPSKTRYTGQKTHYEHPKRACPFYKQVPGTAFVVDGFSPQYDIPHCKSYFLTHFHSDHYTGLNKSFNRGTIYCSKVTKKLLIKQMRISERYIIDIPYRCPTQIENVTVTFYDANHCPGAVCIVFQLENGKIYLHSGDMRYSEYNKDHADLIKLKIDTVYLDTTYCNPENCFPSQEAVHNKAIKIARSHFSHTTLYIVGAYTIGKERLFFSLAKALDSKICVKKDKHDILDCIDLDESSSKRLTLNANEGNIHVLPMNQVNMKALRTYLSTQIGITKIIAFLPTAMIFGQKKSTKKSIFELKIQPEINIEQNVLLYRVPYSEHSSFQELKSFINKLQPEHIIPTVNNSNVDNVSKMVSALKGK